MPTEPADIKAAREVLNILTGNVPDNSLRNRAEADRKARQNDPNFRMPPQPAVTRPAPSVAAEFARKLEQAELLKRAPRCQHIKTDGVRCGSPALRHKNFCHFHHQLRVPKPRLTYLPALEDANGVQYAIMQVTQALLNKQIDRLTANSLLYALQTAASNLKRVRFEPLLLELASNNSGAA
jgi:hypothetical protein